MASEKRGFRLPHSCNDVIVIATGSASLHCGTPEFFRGSLTESVDVSVEQIVIKVDSDLEELIPGFLENRAKDVVRLREALGRNDLPAIQSIGHSLKGVGGGYGFLRLSEIGAEMERAAKANNPAPLADLINALSEYLSRIVVEYG